VSAVAHIKEYKSGKFYSDDFRAGLSWNGHERNVLLRNDGSDDQGNLRFTNVAVALGADDRRDARGMAVADFDNDGDLDMVINNNPGDLLGDADHARAVFLRNDIGAGRSWIAVELEGTQSNRDGIGSLVTIDAAGARQIRHASIGGGYASQHSTRLYFGLNTSDRVDSLTIQWPSGIEQRFDNISARQIVRVTEGQGIATSPLPSKPAVRLSSN
jgi:hypothetical protein